MDFLKNININLRVNLIFTLLFTVLFSLIGFFIYKTQKDILLKNTEKTMDKELSDFIEFIEIQQYEEQIKLTISLNMFSSILQQNGSIVENPNEKIELEAINQETKEAKTILINQLYIDGQPLFNSTKYIDRINSIANVSATIFQKFNDGYVRISTNLTNENGLSAVGTYIPNSSPVVAAIENGEVFLGPAIVLNDNYLTAYRPLYISGKIKGMIYVGVKQISVERYKNYSKSRHYFKNGHLFLVTKNGEFALHPLLEGESIRNTHLFKILQQNATSDNKKILHKWPEQKNSELAYIQYNKNKQSGFYVGLIYYEKDILEQIFALKIAVIIAVILCSLSVTIIFTITLKIFLERLKRIRETLEKLSLGEITNEVTINTNDEIGKTSAAVNQMLKSITHWSIFSNDIRTGNLTSHFVPLSPNDMIGNSLLLTRNNLLKTKQEVEERKKEEELQSWINNGLAKFVEILRFNNENRDELAYSIISNMVKYLNANQGGLFVINDDNPQDTFIELIACYAYDKRRMNEQHLPIGSGLIGRVIKEKQTIHLTEIPHNYISITSGLGDSTPDNLIIVPLIFNDTCYGVIELASFTSFLQHQILFVERIGESIASTIGSLKISYRTESLLKKSQKQSEIMAVHEKEITENLTELQILKEKSEIKESELQGLFKALNATSVVIEYDTTGKILNVNNKFLTLFGLNQNDVIGKFHKSFSSMNPESTEYKNFWNDLINLKTRQVIQSLNINEKNIWLSETYTPVPDQKGNVYKIINIATDITENKMLEKQLRVQVKEMQTQERDIEKKLKEVKRAENIFTTKELYYESMIKGLDESFIRIEIDKNQRIVFCNQLFNTLIGFKFSEINEKDIKIFLRAGTLEDFEIAIEKATQQNSASGIMDFTTKAENYFGIRYIIIPIPDSDGNIIKMLIFGYLNAE